MLHVTLLGLGDIIDDTDPCTVNPSDPICQATASDTAQDPCVLNPNASYCQAAVVQQSASLPTPGASSSSDSSWLTSFINSLNPSKPATPTAPTLNPTKPQSASAAASLTSILPSKKVLFGLGVLIAIGAVVHHMHKQTSGPASSAA